MADNKVLVVWTGSTADVTSPDVGYAVKGEPVEVARGIWEEKLRHQPRNWKLYEGPSPDDLQAKTVDELKAAADQLGISYTSRVTKDGLIRLIEMHAAEDEAVDEPDEEES